MSWLDELAAGDLVVVHRGAILREMSVEKVEHATKCFVDVGRQRFRREDGRLVGATPYSCLYLVEPTTENIEKANRQKLERKAERVIHDDRFLSEAPWELLDEIAAFGYLLKKVKP